MDFAYKMNADDLLASRNFELHLNPNSNGRLLLAFLNETESGSLLWLKSIRKSNCNVLAIRSKRLPWRACGLDRLVDEIPMVAFELRTILAALAPTAIYVFGHSLSAFPAIVLGTELGAERIIALSPETLLGMAGSRSGKYLPNKPAIFEDADLRKYLKSNPPKDLRIVAGELDVVDMYFAARLRKIPGVKLYSLPNAGHSTITTLSQSGELKRMLRTLHRRRFSLTGSEILGGLLPHSKRWYKASRLLDTQPASAEEELRALLELAPTNRSMMIHLAEALWHQDRLGEAIGALDKAGRIEPLHPKIALKIRQLKKRMLAAGTKR